VKSDKSRHARAIKLTGKPGYWVVLDPRSHGRVAEGRTLKSAADRAAKLGVENPVFTQIPTESCTLVM
jgi:hypothetical protein